MSEKCQPLNFNTIMMKRNDTHLLFLIFAVSCINAQERILDFFSDIVVHPDASMTVTENIRVLALGKQIRRGIVREFPTRYRDYLRTEYTVGFELQKVLHNNEPTPYSVENVSNGKKISIGDERRIEPGQHLYTIQYKTNRQIGFFADHDELFWNVTGNGWRLPIDKASARIQLPADISLDHVKRYGYTGYFGSQNQDYVIETNNNAIIFTTNKPLKTLQGLSVVVGWPKGYLQEPAWWQKLYWFIADNVVLLLMMLAGLWLLSFFVVHLYWAYKARQPGLIIPLFYPPADFSPSEVGFIKRRQLNDALYTADLVHLAVLGFITISYEKKGIKGSEYTLLKNENAPDISLLKPYQQQLLHILFEDNSAITLNKKQRENIAHAQRIIDRHCNKYIGEYILTNGSVMGVMWAAIFAVIVVGILANPLHEWIVLMVVFGLGIVGLTSSYLKTYTPRGRKLQDEIDGFELFLTTTETERMHAVGTPPTKNPQLYEKYLPYAIALGVERQWTQQFKDVFARLESQGTPYIPTWYMGYPHRGFSTGSTLGSALSSAISSAATPPGRVSGFGGGSGGGGSGGGGGGGGGGGR